MANLEEYLPGLNFIGRILQRPPDENFLRELTTMPDEFFLWPGVSTLEAKNFRACFDCNPAAMAAIVADDHLRLFSGPTPLAPPWESVWLEKDRLLFGESTRKVAAIYQDWGLEIVNAGHEPEDHLGLETGFMGYLLDIASSRAKVRSASGKSALSTAMELLNGHIMKYAQQVLDIAAANAHSNFYRQGCINCASMLDYLEIDIASWA